MIRERLSRRAFEALREYSCSIPTGVAVGKVWRCDRNFGTGKDPDWCIREYVRHPTDPSRVTVETREVEVLD